MAQGSLGDLAGPGVRLKADDRQCRIDGGGAKDTDALARVSSLGAAVANPLGCASGAERGANASQKERGQSRSAD